ncbi:hypothetical protein GCM10009850_019800 [Nonomuraea monospora]|uniref:Uncharacterized protein n=1 Tax=Nonomuraea monospora TaxID=568818 RepID=A0ABP5P3Y9_9ACTN
MRTTITKFAVAGAVGVTGLLGAAATAQADVGAGQVSAHAAQPVPPDDDDDLRVADPEGAPVRAGPGPAYEIVDRMSYSEPVQYEEMAGYIEMTQEEAAQIAGIMPSGEMPSGQMMPGGEMPSGEMPGGETMPGGEMPSGEMMPGGEVPSGEMVPGGEMPGGEIVPGGETDGDDTSGGSAAHDVYGEMNTGDLSGSSAATPGQATTSYPAAYVVQQVANAIGPSTSEDAWLDVGDGYVWLGDVEPD